MVLILRGVHRPIWTNILRYSHNNTSVKTNFSPYFLLSRTPEVAPQSYHIRRLGCNNMTGANIPALKHQSPSELRRKACLGENSTRMGDLLGSPCVAPLLPFSERHFFDIYIWNLFDLCSYFPVGCRAKVRKEFLMGTGVGKLVGPIGGARVLHWLAVRIEGRRQVRMRRVIGGSYGGQEKVEQC